MKIKREKQMSKLTFFAYQIKLYSIQSSFPVFGTPNCLPAYAMGLPGEVGEVCEILKRFFREGIEPDKDQLTKELGDVVAYVVCIASYYEIAFEDICETNIEKLLSRQKRGKLEGSGDNR